MDVFKDFALNNTEQNSEIDYFYILDHLENSNINVKEIKELFEKRFTDAREKKVKDEAKAKK